MAVDMANEAPHQKQKVLLTVANLRQIEVSEVPPLQAIGGVGDVAGDGRLAISYHSTWKTAGPERLDHDAVPEGTQ